MHLTFPIIQNTFVIVCLEITSANLSEHGKLLKEKNNIYLIYPAERTGKYIPVFDIDLEPEIYSWRSIDPLESILH